MIQLKELIDYLSLEWHLRHNTSPSENFHRYSSREFINLFKEAREAYNKVLLELSGPGYW